MKVVSTEEIRPESAFIEVEASVSGRSPFAVVKKDH